MRERTPECIHFKGSPQPHTAPWVRLNGKGRDILLYEENMHPEASVRVLQKRRPKTAGQKKKERERKMLRYHETLKFDPVYKAKVAKSTRRWQAKFPEKHILTITKSKCKKYNIPFDLELSDIVIPEVCPILGVKLINRSHIGSKTSKWNSASIDRINPKLGYTKGNIQIISMRANLMKTDSTEEDLIRFADWVYKQYKISPGVS